jgi:hypothetical protein
VFFGIRVRGARKGREMKLSLQLRGWTKLVLAGFGCLVMGATMAFGLECLLDRQKATRPVPKEGPANAANKKILSELLGMLRSEKRALLGKEINWAVVGPELIEALKDRKLAPGTPAPDFSLRALADQRSVRLSDYRGKKPVVLVFGSFGCDVFCSQLARLAKLYDRYKDRAQFLLIYVAEGPHADPLPPPQGPEDVLGRIRRGLRHFKVPFTCLVDEPDSSVQDAYSVLTQGLIIVDQNGLIVLDSGAGLPSGWNLDKAESLLQRLPPT